MCELFYGNQKVNHQQAAGGAAQYRKPKRNSRNTKIGNIMFLFSCFGDKMSDICEWPSVEISCILVNVGRSLRKKREGHRRVPHEPRLTGGFAFLLCLLWLTPTETIMRRQAEFEGACFRLSSGSGIKRESFPLHTASCTTCWGRNRARWPQIRTLQAKRQSLWPPCCQVEKMPFTLQLVHLWWIPHIGILSRLLSYVRLRALATLNLLFTYCEVSLNSLGRKIFYVALMLSF